MLKQVQNSQEIAFRKKGILTQQDLCSPLATAQIISPKPQMLQANCAHLWTPAPGTRRRGPPSQTVPQLTVTQPRLIRLMPLVECEGQLFMQKNTLFFFF